VLYIPFVELCLTIYKDEQDWRVCIKKIC
jgi:hypothetical protein